MITITRALLSHPTTRPSLRTTGNWGIRAMRAVVVHWTANTGRGANATANRNYFNNGSPAPNGRLRSASAHWIVDDRTVLQCVPDNEVAFHCGDKPLGHYKPAGVALMQGYRGLTPNYFTVGVEMCVNSDGVWEKTYSNTVELVARLLIKHGLIPTQVLRHWDVTGKRCPEPFMDIDQWDTFLKNVQEEYVNKLAEYPNLENASVNTKGLNVRSGPSTSHPVLYELGIREAVTIFDRAGVWAAIGEGQWAHSRFLDVG